MRALVFLLVVANLAFFAWAQGYLGERENPDAIRLSQQVAAEKLTVLSRDEPPAPRAEAPKSKAPVVEKKSMVEKCLAWVGLTTAEADRLDTALGENFAALRRARHVIPESASWWVFIPPLANKTDAEKKAAELKRLGAPEFFIIQEVGPNRFAISLGIFSSEQAAEERRESLRTKGVKSAKTARRTVTRAEQLSIEATGQEAMVDAAREALQQQLPDIKTAACGNN
jgi:hypothetical protein